MLHVDDTNFETEVLKSETPVLVDFFADWCGPCKILGPIFEEVSPKYDGKVKFVKLNVDEAQQTAQEYGVMSIPTIIAFKGGEVAQTMVGLQDDTSLVAAAEALLK